MRYLLLLVLLIGCSSYPVKRTAIVHDYIFTNAQKTCANHGGLHYIVVSETIESDSSGRFDDGSKDYPCRSIHGFRCQDQTLFKFNDGVAYCFISESQYEETMQVIDPPPPPKPHHEREFGRGRL
jgi:hypothetical protein